ncbi:MAG: LOG family protein [Thermoleophilia bacterium]
MTGRTAGVPQVAVFGSARIRPGEREYEQTRALGAAIAREGWAVCTGGYHGAMEAASAGAAGDGGRVVGVTVAGWAARLSANRFVGEERTADGLLARLQELLTSDAWVAVAGGMGTLAEVALAWNMLQMGEVGARPLVLMGPRWRALLPALREHLVIDDRDVGLVHLADGPDDVVARLRGALGDGDRDRDRTPL